MNNKKKIFYISDLHFGHFNIIRYDNRPFKTIQEMNETLIANWNAVVTDKDDVYVLGDSSWLSDAETAAIFRKLKGNKIIIKGNHDLIGPELNKEIKFYTDKYSFYDNGVKVILDHFPTPFWDGQFRHTIHLYGHVHNSHQWHMMENWLKEARQLQDIPMEAINVGCMMEWMDYTPKTLDQIRDGYKKYLERIN